MGKESKDAVEKITEYKVIIVGGSRVGKFALLYQYTENIFIDILRTYTPHIYGEGRRRAEVDGESCMLDFVVMPTERIRPTLGVVDELIIRNHDGFLYVYAIDDTKSFEDIQYIQEQIQKARGENQVPIVLVGNKCDLLAEENVTSERARDYAADMNIPFIEASAKTKVGMEEAFHTLVREIRKDKESKRQENKKKRKCVIL